MKLKMLTATAAFALSLGATSATASCGKVSITEMDWASSAVVTAVANFLMTQGYGCDVQVVPSSTVPALTSLAETGEPDILTEVWANSTPAYEGLLAEGFGLHWQVLAEADAPKEPAVVLLFLWQSGPTPTVPKPGDGWVVIGEALSPAP